MTKEELKSSIMERRGVCPVCHYSDLDNKIIERKKNITEIKVWCENCESAWVEILKLEDVKFINIRGNKI